MKRAFDLLLAAVALAAMAVPMLLIAAAIGLVDGWPVLFVQERIGRGMRPFRLLKFRTMRWSPAGGNDLTVGEDPRTTRLGRWLRRRRLDELPQLLNILAGQMSFVGPRPEVPRFVDAADPLWREVCLVRPGLVDPATLAWLDEAEALARADDWEAHYRRVILPDKLARSVQYIRHRCLLADVRLLAGAAARVLLPSRRS